MEQPLRARSPLEINPQDIASKPDKPVSSLGLYCRRVFMFQSSMYTKEDPEELCVHKHTLEGLPSGLLPRASGLLCSAGSLAEKVI